MASKVMIKIPAVDFNQVGKHGADLVNTATMCGPPISGTSTSATLLKTSNQSPMDPILRNHQLEQKIRFLKDQHQSMLSALHNEVEALRNRNRDLQFQLVFVRGGANVKKSPASSEEASNSQVLISSSQQTTPSTGPVENLEKDISELKQSLDESRAQNAKLQSIIGEQQRKLAELTIKSVERSQQPSEREISLANQLQETEKLVYRMRRVHDEQRRELALLKGNKNRSHHTSDASTEIIRHHPAPSQKDAQPSHSQSLRGSHQVKPRHQHHHQSHHNLQQQQQQPPHHQRHEPPHYQREHQTDLSSTHSTHSNRFPPLPAQAYWQNNGQLWPVGVENGRHMAGRPSVQSMPSLPAINPANHQVSGPRRHYYRGSGGSTREDNQDGSRRYRGRAGNGSGGKPHRVHDE